MKNKLIIILVMFVVIWSLQERSKNYHNVINSYLKIDAVELLDNVIDRFGLDNNCDGVEDIIQKLRDNYSSFTYTNTQAFGTLFIESGKNYNINNKNLTVISLKEPVEYEISINSENMKVYADKKKMFFSTFSTSICIEQDSWKVQINEEKYQCLFFGTSKYRIGITIQESMENTSIIYNDDYYYYFSNNHLLLYNKSGQIVITNDSKYSKSDIETMMYILIESLT